MAASADWASLMVCSNTTGSKVARCLVIFIFTSALASSWRITRSQGVAAGRSA